MNVACRLMLGFTLAVAIIGTAAFARQASPESVPPGGAQYRHGPGGTMVPLTTYFAPGQGYAMMAGSKQHQLQSQSAQLAQQYAKAEKEDEKKDLRKKLAELLGQQFDLHSQQQQKELEDLEKQIAHLRTVWKKRQDAKSSIVERRLEQLVQEAEGLGWNAPGSPARGMGGVPGFGSSGAFGSGAALAPPAPLVTPAAAPKKP